MQVPALIKRLETELPDIVSSQELVHYKVFAERHKAIYYAKCKDRFLPHFKMGRKYKFLKYDVIDWLKLHWFNNKNYIESGPHDLFGKLIVEECSQHKICKDCRYLFYKIIDKLLDEVDHC